MEHHKIANRPFDIFEIYMFLIVNRIHCKTDSPNLGICATTTTTLLSATTYGFVLSQS